MKLLLFGLFALAAGAGAGWFTGQSGGNASAIEDGAKNGETNAALSKAEGAIDKNPKAKAVVKAESSSPSKDPLWVECVAFTEVVASTDPQSFGSLLTHLSSGTESPELVALKLRTLAARWQDVDAAGLANAAKEHPELAAAWAKVAPDAVLAWTQPGQAGESNIEALKAAGMALADTDPKKALEVCAQLEGKPGANTNAASIVASKAIARLAETDRANAFSQAILLSEKAGRAAAFQSLATSWLKESPVAAQKWAEGLVEPADKKSALAVVVSEFAKTDVDGAIELWKEAQTGDAAKDLPMRTKLARSLAVKDLPKAFSFLVTAANSTTSAREVEALFLISCPQPSLADFKMAFDRPELADRGELDFNNDKNEGFSACLKRWNPTDVSAAIQEASALPGSKFKTAVLEYLGSALTAKNQTLTADVLKKFPEEVRGKLVETTLAKNAEDGKIDEIFKTASLIEDDDERSSALFDQAEVIAEYHPSLAKEFLAKCPVEEQESIVDKLVEISAGVNPKIALELAASRPKEEQYDLVYEATQRWGDRDIYAASEYVKALPNGYWRDNAVVGIVHAMSEDSPEDALAWVLDIQNNEGRIFQLAMLFEEWGRKEENKAAAESAFASLKMSAAEKKALGEAIVKQRAKVKEKIEAQQ